MKKLLTKARKITLGTKEWADSNVNCYFGCSNDCRYCYAKKMAIRFKRKTEDDWKFMIPNQKAISKGYRKRNGRVMFPTSHDITTENLVNCINVLKKLVEVGNSILITTKPNYDCIKKICEVFSQFKGLIQFRFTITSIDDNILKFWERGAPNFKERYKSLKFAFRNGFKTSISIEPFLDQNPYALVDILIPYVSESIWIGKMNYIDAANLNQFEEIFYKKIRLNNRKANLINIVEKSRDYNDIIRIKDSIHNYLVT